jgi:hypothetical protein
MILQIMSDASYLSRPNAGSVAGAFHHLGIPEDPSFVNAPISIASTRIPDVCSSLQEAEWAGTFGAARTAITERQTLADLGYPQPPTLLHCDNEVAVGIANKAVKAKLSKACDMRLHWLIDRVSQGQFLVCHLRDQWSITDFFTKTLPLARHRFFAPFVAVDFLHFRTHFRGRWSLLVPRQRTLLRGLTDGYGISSYKIVSAVFPQLPSNLG